MWHNSQYAYVCICTDTNLHLPSGFWGRSQNPGDDSYYTIGPSCLEEVRDPFRGLLCYITRKFQELQRWLNQEVEKKLVNSRILETWGSKNMLFFHQKKQHLDSCHALAGWMVKALLILPTQAVVEPWLVSRSNALLQLKGYSNTPPCRRFTIWVCFKISQLIQNKSTILPEKNWSCS